MAQKSCPELIKRKPYHASHPTAVADWRHVQEILDRGEIQVSDAQPDRLWGFARIDGRDRMAVLTLFKGAWRALTFFAPKASSRANQLKRPGRRVALEEEPGKEGDADGGP